MWYERGISSGSGVGVVVGDGKGVAVGNTVGDAVGMGDSSGGGVGVTVGCGGLRQPANRINNSSTAKRLMQRKRQQEDINLYFVSLSSKACFLSSLASLLSLITSSWDFTIIILFAGKSCVSTTAGPTNALFPILIPG